MRTTWDLSVFYKGLDDPGLENDLKKIESSVIAFADKYSESDFSVNKDTLLPALQEYEVLYEEMDGAKPMVYYYLHKYLDASNSEVEARINKLSDILSKLENKILFFELKIGKIPVKLQKQILASERFSKYRYFLKVIFDNAKYQLSEQEEKILNLKSLPSYSMWTRGQEKLLLKQQIEFEGKQIPMSEAANQIPHLETKKRRDLHSKFMSKLHEISDFAESELNAIYTDKKINDELRGFTNPYDATFLSNENTEKEILALVKAVKDHYSISHKFYNVKKNLLGLEKLTYADRSAEYGESSKEFSFEESVEIIRNNYSKLGSKYESILDKFMEKGQIDVFPKQNKEGGAFCLGTLNNPTMVLLNFVGSSNDVKTFAHEMGHAIHTEFSKSQPAIYQDYSFACAETASTLFEDFAFDSLLQKMDEKEKVIEVHNRLNDEVSTIFRQIAFFDFELEVHSRIREKGFASKEEIAEIMNEKVGEYLGSEVELSEDDGYFFVYLSHARRFFYVYSYAYGRLISRYLYRNFEKDPSFITKIETFLNAGGSKSPHDIFAEMGIDTEDPNFWVEGLKGIEEEIGDLEKLIR